MADSELLHGGQLARQLSIITNLSEGPGAGRPTRLGRRQRQRQRRPGLVVPLQLEPPPPKYLARVLWAGKTNNKRCSSVEWPDSPGPSSKVRPLLSVALERASNGGRNSPRSALRWPGGLPARPAGVGLAGGGRGRQWLPSWPAPLGLAPGLAPTSRPSHKGARATIPQNIEIKAD